MKPPTFTPTGIEAQVCEDIARRQQLGIHKYGRTVAENPLALNAWMQHLYEELLDAAVYVKRAMSELRTTMAAATSTPQPPASAPKPLRRDTKYLLNGERYSIQQLADMAGCSWSCMQSRLNHNSVEAAVAMGPADPSRSGNVTRMLEVRAENVQRYLYNGKQLSVPELAELAGCLTETMRSRLRTMGPDAAVAMGANRKRARLTTPRNTPTMPLKREENFAADAPVIVPPTVKRTVAPAPVDRFAVQQVPSHFAARRPGQYDDDAGETALARAGVARGAA